MVAVYDIGGGEKKLVENRQMFNDGNYHVAVFERSDQNATFRVDSYPVHRFNTAGTSGEWTRGRHRFSIETSRPVLKEAQMT